mgnify:CR=1
MKPSLYKIESLTPGAFYLMPKPSGEWLREDIEYYAHTGIKHVVSLLEPNEISELGLLREEDVCKEVGIFFTSFAIPDRHIPENDKFDTLVAKIAKNLNEGISVAIHCRAGIGRSGLLACCILKFIGLDSEKAISLVSEARGLVIPDTRVQVDFIHSFARSS